MNLSSKRMLKHMRSWLRGIPIVYVEPRNTSKECSRCG
ncbi:MAG: zinc ribbon domain-containing protein, partial [Nitrososphaerales archaeon]